MAYSPAARDDSDYFVVTLASICMNNDKQYQPVSDSNWLPALFPVLNAVDKSYEKRIVENLLSSFEVNAVVLESRLVLVFVPLESHHWLYLQNRAYNYVLSMFLSAASRPGPPRGDDPTQNRMEIVRTNLTTAIGIKIDFVHYHHLHCRQHGNEVPFAPIALYAPGAVS